MWVGRGCGAGVAESVSILATSSGDFGGAGEGDDGSNSDTDDPAVVDYSNNGDPSDDDLSLSSGSAAINSGPEEDEVGGPPGYTSWNDLDDSRNDRGATGGEGAASK